MEKNVFFISLSSSNYPLKLGRCDGRRSGCVRRREEHDAIDDALVPRRRLPRDRMGRNFRSFELREDATYVVRLGDFDSRISVPHRLPERLIRTRAAVAAAPAVATSRQAVSRASTLADPGKRARGMT